MSDYQIRELAEACAPRIAAQIEQVVLTTVRQSLPGVIADVLREKWAGESVRLYVAKRSTSSRRDRDIIIRAQYNGHNCAELAHRFGLSQSMVFKIVAGKK